MLDVLFRSEGWEDYLYRQTQDKRELRRVNALIKDIRRNPFGGIGKPEPFDQTRPKYTKKRSRQMKTVIKGSR